MAPEFFPFIAFGGLVLVALAGLVVTGGLFVLAWYLRRTGARRWIARLTGLLSWLACTGVIIVVALVVFLGGRIRQQYFLNEPFATACGSGDIAQAQQLLSRGASPDAYGIDFVDTALTAASGAGHREIVALLIRSGARLDLKDSAGKTALDRAEENGHSDIVRMLRDASKDHSPKKT